MRLLIFLRTRRLNMRIKLLMYTVMLLATTVYAGDNQCEKLWNNHKNSPLLVQKIKVLPCQNIWEDAKKANLVKKMGLNPKNAQWQATGECQQIQQGQNIYTLYDAHYQNDLSDLKMIEDTKGNMFAYFRDLGVYDMSTDQFKPTKNANKNGVELKCADLGNSENLIKILSIYIQQKNINMLEFSYDDFNK